MMVDVVRFNLSVPKLLLEDFDRAIKGRFNRSEALRMAMRATIVELGEKAASKTIDDLLEGRITLEELKKMEKEMNEGKPLLEDFERGSREMKQKIKEERAKVVI